MSVNEEAEILKKLGIISGPSSPQKIPKRRDNAEGSQKEFEEVQIGDGSSASTGSPTEAETDEEYDVIYDRESLLLNPSTRKRQHSINNRMSTSNSALFTCRPILIYAAFFSIGLCLSIIGPTLPDIQIATATESIVSVVGIVSAEGFGALLGVTFGGLLHSCLNSFLLIFFLLCGCSLFTLAIPFCTTIATVTFICFLQGITIGMIEKGGYCMFFCYWPKRYHIFQLFYVFLSIGACLSPLISSPFVFNQVQPQLNKSFGNRLLVKREAFSQSMFNTTLVQTVAENAVVTKPMIAMGAGPPQSQKGKNEQNRKEAEMEETAQSLNTTTSTITTAANATTTTGNATETITKSNDTIMIATTTITATASSTTILPATTKVIPVKSPQLFSTGNRRKTTIVFVKDSTAMSSTTKTVSTIASTEVSLIGQRNKLWQSVSILIGRFNRVRLAYSIICIVPILTSCLFLLSFCLCCICRSVSQSTTDSSPVHLCSNRENRLSLCLAFLLVCFLSWVESDLSNLLTIYQLRSGVSQSDGLLLTSLFWFCMSLSRGLSAITSQLFNSTKILLFCVVSSILTTSLLAVFGPPSVSLLWSTIAILGLTLGPIYPLSFCWFDHRLGLDSWSSSLWLLSSLLGRVVGPLLTSYLMLLYGRQLLLLVCLAANLLAGVTFVFLQRMAKMAEQLRAVDKFSRRMKDERDGWPNCNVTNGHYRRLEGVEMDEFDIEDMTNVVHFDRSDDGAFSRYLRT